MKLTDVSQDEFDRLVAATAAAVEASGKAIATIETLRDLVLNMDRRLDALERAAMRGPRGKTLR